MRFLMKRLDNAGIVDPERQKDFRQVFFGATVTYETPAGRENTISIVGMDKVEINEGQVSWISPIARALHKAREGNIVQLRTPSGVERIEVLKIGY